jgi:wyosine [tRNA(Phe)-imidazoG37] synthetase (radical SAM superfamily)
VVKELDELPPLNLDYITFSGTGEPTLAANLGDMIGKVKARFNKPVAVLTNSSLLQDPQVRQELSQADLVVAKLDAPNEELFQLINRPTNGVSFSLVVNGIKRFQQEYPGKLALQIMFIPQNKGYAAQMAALAKEIDPIEVQVNTPLRPSPVTPLPPAELAEIKELFHPLKVYSVYEVDRPQTLPLDRKATEERRPASDN